MGDDLTAQKVTYCAPKGSQGGNVTEVRMSLASSFRVWAGLYL